MNLLTTLSSSPRKKRTFFLFAIFSIESSCIFINVAKIISSIYLVLCSYYHRSSLKEPAENLILSNVFRVGVVSLAKTLSKELIKHNITINNVCPGAFKTDRAVELMLNESKITNKSIEEIEGISVCNLPLKRFQTPEELGNLVAFLASDIAKGITGTTIQIDGGIIRSLF